MLCRQRQGKGVNDIPISYYCADKDKEKGRVAGPKTRKARVVHAIVLSDMLLLVNKKGDQHELLMEVCGATGSDPTANPSSFFFWFC
jgi:hypothetical protein